MNSYHGRISRTRFFFYIVLALISIPLFVDLIFYYNNAKTEYNNIKIIWGFALLFGILILYSFAIVKRFHDINLSGWFLIIPLVNIYYLFISLFQAGNFGPNKYGDDPIRYKTLKEKTTNGIQFLTPPRWDSWQRYFALILAIFGLLLCYDISFLQIRYAVVLRGFSLLDIFLLWPLILLWIGWFNFIGAWDYANRIVIEDDKATFYILGFWGNEKKTITMESINTFKNNWVIGISNGKEEECFIKRKYLSTELRNELMKIRKGTVEKAGAKE